jgi:hypothetical protein
VGDGATGQIIRMAGESSGDRTVDSLRGAPAARPAGALVVALGGVRPPPLAVRGTSSAWLVPPLSG